MKESLQRQVIKYLSRLAGEIVHQGAATVRFRWGPLDGECAMLRSSGIATTRAVSADNLTHIARYIESRIVVDPPRAPLFFLRTADRVVECRVQKGLDFIALEVQGMLTLQAWVEELGLDVSNRSGLLGLQDVHEGWIAVGGLTEQDAAYAGALLATMLQVAIVSERDADSEGEQGNQPVGILRRAKDPLELASTFAQGARPLQGMLFVRRQLRVCPLCHGKRSASGSICTRCQDSGHFGVIPNLVALRFIPPLQGEPPDFLKSHRGRDLLELDAAFKVEQGMIAKEVASEITTAPRASASLAQPQSVKTPQAQRILLVEDDVDQRSILQTYLKKLGYEVHAAEDGLRALSLLQHLVPDLIITDLMMPNMDGAEFITQVRRESRFAGVPILVLTVVEDDERELNALELGADDYCEKTMQRRLLVKRIERLLEKRR
ncbi:MAG: response regulator [Bdellovibrionota bacterium]|nr:MAG: response regulator [Bdellovibrionota bacterium]